MHKGTISCECGQEFYYETIKNYIYCINCGKEYYVKEDIVDLYIKDEAKAKEGD